MGLSQAWLRISGERIGVGHCRAGERCLPEEWLHYFVFSRCHGLPPSQDAGVWNWRSSGERSTHGALVESALAGEAGANWHGGDYLCSGVAGEGKCGKQRKIGEDGSAIEDGS